MSKTIGCNSVDDNWDGLNVSNVVQVGSGSASGMINCNSETLTCEFGYHSAPIRPEDWPQYP